MKVITINTDAGFYPHDKVGSWAFWIVSDGLLLKGSGLFKDLCKSPTDAETKAICNAVSVLLKANYEFEPIKKIIINRDNIHAIGGKSGSVAQQKLTKLLRSLKRKCNVHSVVEYRHVKAHNGTNDKRSYVNDWCDKQCTIQLKQWKLNNKTT